MSFTPLDDLICNTIRCVAVEMVARADSGHQGLPLGFAPTLHVLCSRHLRVCASQSDWIARDRLVFSAGHGSALLYTMMHFLGFEETRMDDLKAFRTLGSTTPGHPESVLTKGVEFTTGPLGQGIGGAVGMALASKQLGGALNTAGEKVVDSLVYIVCGDGCLQEGISHEAASFAGHSKLGNLILLYDDNHTTIDGHTDVAWTDDVYKSFEALGWHTAVVEDGDKDYAGISAAIDAAKAVTDKPSIIGIKTTIGFGTPVAGTNKAHGYCAKLPVCMEMRKKFGLPEEHFAVVAEVYKAYEAVKARGVADFKAWEGLVASHLKTAPEKGAMLASILSKTRPSLEEFLAVSPKFSDSPAATRTLSGKVLNSLASIWPAMIGGAADLAGSCKTDIAGEKQWSSSEPSGRILRFGIREHAMGAICNGLAEFGAHMPFCATFLVFQNYMLPAIRIAALSELQVLYILTHDSVALGQDGPTHQPIESIMQLRQMPHLQVFRPADGVEVVAGYAAMLNSTKAPTALILTRQNVKPIAGSDVRGAMKGGYVVVDCDKPKAILVASGSEVSLCCSVAEAMGGNVRVVSLPCWKLFEKDQANVEEVLLNSRVPIVSVECGTIPGWERWSHVQIGLKERFGLSAPGSKAYEACGFSVDAIKSKLTAVMKHYEGRKVPDIFDYPKL